MGNFLTSNSVFKGVLKNVSEIPTTATVEDWYVCNFEDSSLGIAIGNRIKFDTTTTYVVDTIESVGKIVSAKMITAIDSSSTDSQLSSAKAIRTYTAVGTIIPESTDPLTLPYGRYAISTNAVAEQMFNDGYLPDKYSGTLEIETIAAREANPMQHTYCYRMLTYKPYRGETFTRKLQSGNTAGVFTSDTGWVKMCVTKNNDTAIITVELDSSVWSAGTVKYCIKNGLCHVSIEDLVPVAANNELILSENMPKAGMYRKEMMSVGSSMEDAANPTFAYIPTGSSTITVCTKDNSFPLYGSLIYLVSES